VTVYNGDRRADGKNIWDLMGLLVFPGMEVILEVEGADAATALEPLAAVLGATGGEDYTI
jgi:phosphotransferase system HPr-like phosphotransfer protein